MIRARTNTSLRTKIISTCRATDPKATRYVSGSRSKTERLVKLTLSEQRTKRSAIEVESTNHEQTLTSQTKKVQQRRAYPIDERTFALRDFKVRQKSRTPNRCLQWLYYNEVACRDSYRASEQKENVDHSKSLTQKKNEYSTLVSTHASRSMSSQSKYMDQSCEKLWCGGEREGNRADF